MAGTIEDAERPSLTLKELIERKDYSSVGYRIIAYAIMSPVMILCFTIVLPVLAVATLIGWLTVKISNLLEKKPDA